jgi:hypothetical protein
MQAKKENLSPEQTKRAIEIWQHMMNVCKEGCAELAAMELHKQWASRPLEWFSTIKLVVTASRWEGMFALRDHGAAQDEIAHLTQAIKVAMAHSTPVQLLEHEWHIPYGEDLGQADLLTKLKVSAARCARVSYKTFHGTNSTIHEDFELFKRLYSGGGDQEDDPFHASPTEHQAREAYEGELIANNFGYGFSGLVQFRQCVEDPAIPLMFRGKDDCAWFRDL